MSDYADTAERDAAIATIKDSCRKLIAELVAYRPGEIATMPVWIDGVWGDYWYVELNGSPVGEIYYDGFGPVPKGDELGELIYRASRAAELAAERETWRPGRCYRCAADGQVRTTRLSVGWRPTCARCSA